MVYEAGMVLVKDSKPKIRIEKKNRERLVALYIFLNEVHGKNRKMKQLEYRAKPEGFFAPHGI